MIRPALHSSSLGFSDLLVQVLTALLFLFLRSSSSSGSDCFVRAFARLRWYAISMLETTNEFVDFAYFSRQSYKEPDTEAILDK